MTDTIEPDLLMVGGDYRTQGGQKVHLLAYYAGQAECWFGALLIDGKWIPETFSAEGRWCSDIPEHSRNIVAVWKEPLDFDWHAIPYWCDEIARHSDSDCGHEYGYEWLMRRRGYGGWLPIPEHLYPTNWTEDMGTRFERPTNDANS